MNKRKFFIISLIFTLIYSSIMFLCILLNNSSLEKSFKAESDKIFHHNCELVTNLVRNDLLMNNLRGARIKLDELMRDGFFSSYSILRAPQPKATTGPSEYFVPVYFGAKLNGDLWGGIEFTGNSKNSSNSLMNFFKKSGQSLILTALLSGLFMFIIFLSLLMSTSKMEKTIRDIITFPEKKRIIPRGIWINLLFKVEKLALERHQFQKEALEGLVAKAIARTTQMLAHDVRRPFSMLKSGLSVLHHTSDPTEFKSKVLFLTKEVERATKAVDGMITDVMEIGASKDELIKEPVAPESLIESCLLEIFRMYPHSDVLVEYNFTHRSMVDVHPEKMGRVLSNIVINAVQAMDYKGQIWFKTKEMNNYVEFVIGNSGSYIPKESLNKLFESFFTSRKKHGTGLGLAIAKKLVEAHLGTIWCESSRNSIFPEGVVEFHFTLPAISGLDSSYHGQLPKSSKEIANPYVMQQDSQIYSFSKDESIRTSLEKEVISFNFTLSILLVDDENLYTNHIKCMILASDAIKNIIEIKEARDHREALTIMRNFNIDLLISDIDLGSDLVSGLDLVEKIRTEIDFRGVICIHSNRIGSEDTKGPIGVGADSFLPKPMTQQQLLKLLLLSAEKKGKLRKDRDAERQSHIRPEMALVEDDPFIREHWVNKMESQAIVHQYSSPESFAQELEKDATLIERLCLIVTDYYFEESEKTGLDVGSRVKSLRSELPVLLSSNGDFSLEKFRGDINRIISKDPPAKFEDLLT